MRYLAFDQIRLDPKKIIKDNDDELVIRTVVASEIVHEYADGFAYKPADELKKAAWTLDGRWIKLMEHPEHGLLQRKSDVSGYIDNSKFVKNLKDPKTGRNNRRGIMADTHFFKHDRGRHGLTPLPQEMYDRIKTGNLLDVSVGFTFEKDITAGSWNGVAYDYAQRGFFFDHVVAPCETGRCPSPYCGIGMDQMMPIMIGLDPWESGEEYIRSGHVDPNKFDPASLRTINIEGAEGVKSIVGCPKGQYEAGKCKVGMEVQSFLFNKNLFTMEQAKVWFNSHKGDMFTIIKGDQNLDQETKEEFMNKCVESEKTEAECETLWNELQAGDQAIGLCVARCIILGNSIESCREKCKGGDAQDQNQCVCPECHHEFTSEEQCSEAACPECAHVGCAILIEKVDTYAECVTECLEAGGTVEECAEKCKDEAPAESDCPLCDMVKNMSAKDRVVFIRKYGKDFLRVLSTPPDSSASAGVGDIDIVHLLGKADDVVKRYLHLTTKKRGLHEL